MWGKQPENAVDKSRVLLAGVLPETRDLELRETNS